MATNISFNSNDLQTDSILTAQINHSSPTKNVKVYSISHENRSVIPFINYPNRVISISGKLVASSIAACDALEDTFKGYLLGKNNNLDIDHNSGTRRYIATVNSISIDRPGGLAFADFEVEFICSEPFGRATALTAGVNVTGITAVPDTNDHTFIGTAPLQYPVILITINSLTGGTGATIDVGNNATGQEISVTRNWAADEVLEIDTFNKTVKVDDVEVAFSGAFPVFEPGAGTLTYSDDLSARNVDIDLDYYARYL